MLKKCPKCGLKLDLSTFEPGDKVECKCGNILEISKSLSGIAGSDKRRLIRIEEEKAEFLIKVSKIIFLIIFFQFFMTFDAIYIIIICILSAFIGINGAYRIRKIDYTKENEYFNLFIKNKRKDHLFTIIKILFIIILIWNILMSISTIYILKSGNMAHFKAVLKVGNEEAAFMKLKIAGLSWIIGGIVYSIVVIIMVKNKEKWEQRTLP